jgi:hypothetical protein
LVVSEAAPEASVAVVEAVPSMTVTGLPRGELPSVNWTVPAAVAGVTVAVSVSVVVASAADESGVTANVMVVEVASSNCHAVVLGSTAALATPPISTVATVAMMTARVGGTSRVVNLFTRMVKLTLALTCVYRRSNYIA